MKTYNDLLECVSEKERMNFILSAIADHKASEAYKTAMIAIEYANQRNTTITKYRKFLYDIAGNAVPDNYTANHKCASNFFSRFVTQEASYLLGNGATFEKDSTKKKLDADFDTKLYKIGKSALIQGEAFGFYNMGHLDVFELIEFVPLLDEEDGALKAGIRFWQIAPSKPLRAVLYEIDGYTEYICRKEKEMEIYIPKRVYRQNVKKSKVDGERIYDGENYPSFPIVPLWGNLKHLSELVGQRENIDAYDLIKSGFANDLDDASMIYWTLENCGGMDDIDLAKFIDKMRRVKAAVIDGGEGAKATAHTMDVPYESRETYLKRLRDDLYEDAMALNTSQISAGNITATQILAAYEPLDQKCDEFEYCVLDFIAGILLAAGLDADVPTFKRSRIVNRQEETEIVLSAAEYLDEETVLRKLPFLTPDEIDDILARKDAESAARFAGVTPDGKEDGENSGDGEDGNINTNSAKKEEI